MCFRRRKGDSGDWANSRQPYLSSRADRIQGFLFLSRRLVEQVGREKLDTAVQPVQDRYPGFFQTAQFPVGSGDQVHALQSRIKPGALFIRGLVHVNQGIRTSRTVNVQAIRYFDNIPHIGVKQVVEQGIAPLLHSLPEAEARLFQEIRTVKLVPAQFAERSHGRKIVMAAVPFRALQAVEHAPPDGERHVPGNRGPHANQFRAILFRRQIQALEHDGRDIVVGVGKPDVLSARGIQPGIPGRRHPRIGLVDDADSFVRGFIFPQDVRRSVRGAVIDADDFYVPERLGADGIQAFFHECGYIVARNDNGNEWHGHQERFVFSEFFNAWNRSIQEWAMASRP